MELRDFTVLTTLTPKTSRHLLQAKSNSLLVRKLISIIDLI